MHIKHILTLLLATSASLLAEDAAPLSPAPQALVVKDATAASPAAAAAKPVAKAAATTPAAEPAKKGWSASEREKRLERDSAPVSPSQALAKTFVGLGFILSLIAVMAWALRRWGRRLGVAPGQGEMRINGRITLDAKNSLVLVRVHEEELLLAVGPNGMIFEAVNIGATIIANEMGYNAAGQFDPSTEQPQTEIAVLLNLCFLNVFLACNGHLNFIAVAVDSFSSLPPGAFALHSDHYEAMQNIGRLAFDFGLRLALPVMATMLLINLALGLVSRFAEDFQVLLISFPIRIAAGLAVLSAAVPLILAAFRELAGRLQEILPRLVGF